MEVLSRMINKAENERMLKGIKVSRNGPDISHLLLADDLLITIRASLTNIRNCKQILENFCNWLGQQINKNKLGIFYSKNTTS